MIRNGDLQGKNAVRIPGPVSVLLQRKGKPWSWLPLRLWSTMLNLSPIKSESHAPHARLDRCNTKTAATSLLYGSAHFGPHVQPFPSGSDHSLTSRKLPNTTATRSRLLQSMATAGRLSVQPARVSVRCLHLPALHDSCHLPDTTGLVCRCCRHARHSRSRTATPAPRAQS